MKNDSEYYDDDFFSDDKNNGEEYRPARNDDPETSQDSADRVKSHLTRFRATSRKGRLLELYGTGGFTDEEAAKALAAENEKHCRVEGWRKRCSELRLGKFIADTFGRRCNPGSPDAAMVCTITEKGRQALRHLRETGWSR
jgi:hypothetical protein